MATLWQRIKRIFNGETNNGVTNNRLPNTLANNQQNSSCSRTNKKFEISNRTNNEQQIMDTTLQRTNKKFEVKETKTINISRLGGNRGFANANVSRPRQCPYCRAEGTIVKASNGRDWECSTDRDGCGYKWR